MTNHPEIRWISAGIAGGLLASILYPLPLAATAAAAAFLGHAIGIGSLGLRQLIRLHGPSVTGSLGAIANFTTAYQSPSPGSFCWRSTCTLSPRSRLRPG